MRDRATRWDGEPQWITTRSHQYSRSVGTTDVRYIFWLIGLGLRSKARPPSALVEEMTGGVATATVRELAKKRAKQYG